MFDFELFTLDVAGDPGLLLLLILPRTLYLGDLFAPFFILVLDVLGVTMFWSYTAPKRPVPTLLLEEFIIVTLH